MKRILITGGAGFVGHHFVEHFLKNSDAHIVVLDKLSYASNGFDRIRDIEAYKDDRVTILSGDFSMPLSEGTKQEIGDVNYILHLGAESHVDNSITNPEPFVRSNVLGTMHILDFAKELNDTVCYKGQSVGLSTAKPRNKFKCFFYFGTDEVFGPAPIGTNYKEEDRHNPTNPYSATKSGGEMLVKAYRNSYGLPAVITRSMNIFGERQHPEKFIPMVIKKVLAGEIVTIHANADRTKAGSRFYIHARNVANGYQHLINLIEGNIEVETFTKSDPVPIDIGLRQKKVIGQDFHITGEREIDNLELAQMIAKILGKELKYEMVDFHSSRPGHDLRYALSGEKMKEYGWIPEMKVENSLEKTVNWFTNPKNKKWLDV